MTLLTVVPCRPSLALLAPLSLLPVVPVQVPLEDVEKWVVEAIALDLIDGRMDQMEQVLVIRYAFVAPPSARHARLLLGSCHTSVLLVVVFIIVGCWSFFSDALNTRCIPKPLSDVVQKVDGACV